MNYCKKLILAFVVLPVLALQPVIAQQVDSNIIAKALQLNPCLKETLVDAVKSMPAESVKENFTQAGKDIIEGSRALGLAFSRFALDFAQNYKQMSTSLSNHYCIFGALIVSAGLFYWYIRPGFFLNFGFNNKNKPENKPGKVQHV